MTTPDGPFWELVKAEFRATWCGRMRYLWWFLATLPILSSATLHPQWSRLGSFVPLCVLTSWLPTWLSSDLFSIRFAGNPEPHREWPLRAFVARGVGRLVPLLVAQTLWVAAFVGFGCLRPEFSGEMFYPRAAVTEAGFEGWAAVAWPLVFAVGSGPFAGLAALLSLTARRPRKPLVTLSTVAIITFAAALLWPALMSFSLPELVWIAPAVYLGGLSAMQMQPDVVRGAFALLCLWAALALALYTIPPVAAATWIAARRFRRHPYTRPVGEDSTAI